MSNWKKELDQLSAIGLLAREAASEPIAAEVHREGCERLVSVAVSRRYAARPRVPLRMAVALAAVVGCAATIWIFRPRPLRYEVHGGSGLEGPYVSAPPSSSVELLFSDGSQLQAEPGTRLRVDDTYSNGARVLLERGSAASHVTHHNGSRWTFVAGPFEVRVTGTRFVLNWDALGEEIDLQLQEGSVEVRSPLGDGPIVVRAGQRFRAAVASRSMSVTAVDAPMFPAASEPAVIPNAPEAAPVSAPAVAPLNLRVGARHESWQDWLARGDYEAVVAGANARGIDVCLSGCSALDLRSLADAARYTTRSDLAEKALHALRQRFSGTGHSAWAAFLLGRISESRAQTASAQRWFDTYLAEAPEGDFAAEALAGKMRAVATVSGAASAKPLAIEYLRRYPKGVHVKTARKIAGLE
ncbi:MAG TPA: FecR domain-containing protein [Polyangiaceae bacterium]